MVDLPTVPLPQLPPRKPEGHKGDYGRALLVGGSRGMSGAIALAGMAALRSGAGLVTLAVPDPCLDVVAGFEPSYMTVPLAADDQGRIGRSAESIILQHAASANCVGIGPGLNRTEGLDDLICGLYRDLSKPLVVDADGLNALATRPEVLRNPGGPRILTPHPGEFRRLTGQSQSGFSMDRMREFAIQLAAQCGIVIVLKGHRSLVTDGDRVAFNSTGNPGMATGGAGDVLTGMVTALVCQGLSPLDAAQLAAHLHGRAGDLAAAELGQVSLTATDLVRYLPRAFQSLVPQGE